MLILLLSLAITAIVNAICFTIFKYKGYQIHHKYWIIEQETTWRDQLEDHYETLYNDEFEALFEREDNMRNDNKFLQEELRKANRDLKKIHIKFSQFFSILIKDSKSRDFLKRNSTPKRIINYYNISLKSIIENVEKEMNLNPCKESTFIKRIFESSRIEKVGK